VVASAIDAAGNQGPASGQTPFTVAAGQQPPAPVVTAPAAGSSTNDTTPELAGTATPGSTVTVRVDGVTACVTTAGTSGQFSCTPTTPLAQGQHQVTATATTSAGTSLASAAVSFTVDSTLPTTPVITAPTAGAQTSTTPTITGTAEAGSTVSVRVDGQLVCEVVADAASQWSCPVTRPLTPGTHEATASATDAAGNRSPVTAPISFTVLGSPTAPVLQQPAASASVSTHTPTFSGLADPGASVEVLVDGAVVCSATADAMGHFSCVPMAPLTGGAHSASAKATTPGGTATSGMSPFTIVDAPAAPVISGPASGANTGSTPIFTGTAEAGSTVTVSVDGVTVCTAIVDTSGHFSCTSGTTLEPGSHAVTATASTSAGTSAASSQVGFTVVAPPALVWPADGTTTTENPPFSGTAAAGSSVSVLVDGVAVCTATADTQGSWACSPTDPLTKGQHSVTVQDGSGIESGVSTITVVSRELAGAGCASSGSSPLPWLLALAMALLLTRRRGLAALALVAGVSAPALAQTSAVPGFELERVRLNGGAQHGLLVESGDILPKFEYRAALTFHYEKDPLVVIEDGKRVGALVGTRIGVHVSGAFSITDWLDVSLQLPVILSQSGDDLTAHGYAPFSSGVAAGTPWLGVRGGLLQERRGQAVDLSLGLALGVPVGSVAALSRDNLVSVIPSVGFGRTLTSWLRLGASVGVLVRNSQSLSSGGGVSDQVGSLVTPSLILSTLGDGLRGELSTRGDLPRSHTHIGAELDLGLRYPLFDLFEVYAVGGPGFGSLPGTPSFRVLAGIALAPKAKRLAACVEGQQYELARCPELDLDADGIPNGGDACPKEPGVVAKQGCPDVDTDQDGLMDSVDACPTKAGPKERQGCPEPDTDGDGLVDSLDACPNVAGPSTYKGCPDSDGDGIIDRDDACPNQAGLVELKGCPDVDTDGDSVVDRLDACRTVPGPKENGGCPAAQKQLVVITRDRLVILEKVSFDTGKTVVLPKSFALLQQVAGLIKDHPEVQHVSIEGHTDSRGSREANVKLSEGRAEAVRQWLLKQGIAADRMSSKGFGPDRPIEPNDTAKGREANRRVDFVIIGAETTTTKQQER
jgi:outer membrane protein OmpA-like peptidoglycan-associated protein